MHNDPVLVAPNVTLYLGITNWQS